MRGTRPGQGLRAVHVHSRLPGFTDGVSERVPGDAAHCAWPALCWPPAAPHAGSATDSKHTGKQLASGVVVRGSPACAAQVLLASFRVYSGLNRKYISEQLTSSAEASTVAEETFGSIRTVTRMPLCRAADASPPGPASLPLTLLWRGSLAGVASHAAEARGQVTCWRSLRLGTALP